MRRYVKFIGDFKILKPMGFKFGKYHARNHKAYTKYQEDSEYMSDMHIWVLGRDLTIGDMNTLQSFWIAKHIVAGTYPVFTEDEIEERTLAGKIVFDVGDSKDNMLNKNTGEIMDHIDLLEKYGILKALKDRVAPEEIPHPGKDGWNEVHISKEAIVLVKEFYEKGLILLVEE